VQYQLKSCMGNTPLLWAARNGHEDVVRILLGRDDVDPNLPSEDGQTPLLQAAYGGREGVVKSLLRRAMSTQTSQMRRAGPRSGGPLTVGIREW